MKERNETVAGLYFDELTRTPPNPNIEVQVIADYRRMKREEAIERVLRYICYLLVVALVICMAVHFSE